MPNQHAAINPRLISTVTGQDPKTVKEKPTFAMLPGQYASKKKVCRSMVRENPYNPENEGDAVSLPLVGKKATPPGHSHPKMVTVAKEQVEKLIRGLRYYPSAISWCWNYFYHETSLLWPGVGYFL